MLGNPLYDRGVFFQQFFIPFKDAADLFKAFGFHAGSKHCLDKLCLLKALEVDLQFLSLFAKLNDL